MQMIESVQIAQYVSVTLLFILVVTGAWRKDFTNTVHVIAIAFFVGTAIVGKMECGFLVMAVAEFITTFRTILHKKNDVMVRGT